MLKKMIAVQGEGGAYQYAEIYSAWSDTRRALTWLRRAAELEDGGLLAIRTHPCLDPIRTAAEFKAIVAKLDPGVRDRKPRARWAF